MNPNQDNLYCKRAYDSWNTGKDCKIMIGFYYNKPTFAILSPVLSAIGSYWSLSVWQKNKTSFCGITELRKKSKDWVNPDDVTLFNFLKSAKPITSNKHIPAYVANILGW